MPVFAEGVDGRVLHREYGPGLRPGQSRTGHFGRADAALWRIAAVQGFCCEHGVEYRALQIPALGIVHATQIPVFDKQWHTALSLLLTLREMHRAVMSLAASAFYLFTLCKAASAKYDERTRGALAQ